MNDMHWIWIDDGNSSVKHQAYKKCKNEVQTALCNIKIFWWTSRAAEFQPADDKKDTKGFYDGLREVFSPRDSGNSLFLSPDGRTL